ncbi:MAG TPA: Xaa-Pro peptidase family protein [Candidatus Corynebacterium gallistercoris]|uniref:Xaa-Pro peptidase family protein n=1 Tax=Candidatus Corynebacterium gallistercoris TaxID=2838530 RepID=A0A9D1RZW4_9CORY|nr:Xaa-Pro peptidase family protein [Candidatus Corynebacterium gallistercoris]
MSTFFPLETYSRRLNLVTNLAAKAGLDGIVITPGPDMEYLLGLTISTHERFTALVVTTKERKVIVPAVDAADVRNSAAGELGVEVIGWRDGEDPYAPITPGDYAVSASTTADHLLELQNRGLKTVNATQVLAQGFVRKEAAELEQLRRASSAIDEVHRAVPGLLKAGVTENEVAAELEKLILREHVAVDFIIVGSGPHGADPHHSHSDRVIEDGDVVVVDLGGTLDSGYHSDCTRTYVVGEASAEQRDIYATLKRAHQAGLGFAKPGVTAGDIDKVVRDVLTEAGYGEYFSHRTGHGIGLSTHEEPFLLAGNDFVIEEGMCFSIEPGVYFTGQWGARIEDIVVVTADGVEPINTTSHELLSVG